MASRRSVMPRDRAVVVGFTGPAERRSVLDRAHRGDIEGAFGLVPACDTSPRTSLHSRLAALLAIMGPGLVVMVADNDAGGLSVYAQAGQDHGLRLLWLLVLLAPVLYVNQEMVARLGAVSGAGHARLIFERFGRRWGYFAVADLLLLNLLTIVTEFIGVALALGYFGLGKYVSVPVAAMVLIVVTGTGSFRRWERAMYVLVALSFVVVPLAVVVVVHHPPVAHALPAAPHAPLAGSALLLVIALVGTTVAPWQLFFHQSNVVDKRITPWWLGYERLDTLIGTALFTLAAVAVLAASAVAFTGTALHGQFVDAGQVASGLRANVGSAAGALFAIGLLMGSVLGGGAVTLATSYAIGDAFGLKHSLHRRWRDAPVFHGTFVASIVAAAVVVLIPGAPLGVATIGVQALAGVLLPSATVFLLLLCNDEALLGPRTNPQWLNALASVVVAWLIVLSALLTITTLFPRLDVSVVGAGLGLVAVLVLSWLGATTLRAKTSRAAGGETAWDRRTWTTPPLASLPAPKLSAARATGLWTLRVYLVVAAVLAVAKIFRLMLHV